MVFPSSVFASPWSSFNWLFKPSISFCKDSFLLFKDDESLSSAACCSLYCLKLLFALFASFDFICGIIRKYISASPMTIPTTTFIKGIIDGRSSLYGVIVLYASGSTFGKVLLSVGCSLDGFGCTLWLSPLKWTSDNSFIYLSVVVLVTSILLICLRSFNAFTLLSFFPVII